MRPIFLFLAVFANTVFAADYSKVYSEKANAVVKVITTLQGVQVGHGSGFFVSNDGYFLTNEHVIRNVTTTGFSAYVLTKTGETLKDIEIVGCEIFGLDICLLKVNYKPKQWISLQDVSSKKEGSSIALIGHPKGLDWTISDGLISSFRTSQTMKKKNYTKIQISAPLSPGNSGCPILDADGKFAGIVTSGIFSDKSQGLNFGVAAESVLSFYNEMKMKTPMTLTNFKKQLNESKKFVTKAVYQDNVESELKRIDAGQLPLKKNKRVSFTGVSGKTYEFLYPELNGMFTCSNQKTRIVCELIGQDFISIAEIAAEKNFKSFHGAQPKSVPMKITQELLASQAFDPKKMDKKNLQYLYTQPSKTKCSDQKGKDKGKYGSCTLFTYNAVTPNSSIFEKVLEFEPQKPLLHLVSGSSEASTSLLIFSLLDYMESTHTNLSSSQRMKF